MWSGSSPEGGKYEELLPETVEIVLFGARCRCLDLPALIRVKRAAGCPRDFEVVAELEVLLEERKSAEDADRPEPG